MSAYKSDFLRVMSERGFIHQISDEAGLDRLLATKRVRAYVGYDATATSLHIGNLISATMLYWFQATGHRPITLMGGGTSMIGDPSFRDEQRKLLSPDAIASNIDGIKRISRPGRRVYVRHDRIPRVFSGLGISILSTSRGLMSDREARKQKVGGELLCEVW